MSHPSKRAFNDEGVGGSSHRSRPRLLDPLAAAAAAAASAPERAGQLSRARLSALPTAFAAQVMAFLNTNDMTSMARTSHNQLGVARNERHAHPSRLRVLWDAREGERIFRQRAVGRAASSWNSLVHTTTEFHLLCQVVLLPGSSFYTDMEGQRAAVDEMGALARTLHEYTSLDLDIRLARRQHADALFPLGEEGEANEHAEDMRRATVALLDPPGVRRHWNAAAQQGIVYVPPSLPDLKLRELTLDMDGELTWFAEDQTFDFLRCRHAPHLETIRVTDNSDTDELRTHNLLRQLSTPHPEMNGVPFCASLRRLELAGTASLADESEFWVRNWMDYIAGFLGILPIEEIELSLPGWGANVQALMGPRFTHWRGQPATDRVLTCTLHADNGRQASFALLRD